VVDTEPPRLFSFRWTHEEGETAARGNSFLVVFELAPAGRGTRLRMTETGFRERGWDEATVTAHHADHVNGWDHFLPRLVAYGAEVGARA
jgi:Activator of Hsp90 ATPase homolog 1-like protein